MTFVPHEVPYMGDLATHEAWRASGIWSLPVHCEMYPLCWERKGLSRTGKYFDEYAKMRQDCRVLAENFNFVLYYYKCSQCNKSMNSVTQ